MSALGTPVLINTNRAYWLSSIASDVIHSTIVVDELDANIARVSTLVAENITASTVNVSSLNFETSDVSGMYVSSLRGNEAFFSSMTIASDLSGGLGYVRFHVDASGVQVDGDPIRFDNLVYLTSTINIIQVSTLVDTDIFALRGFFSTISSGNLTAGSSYLSSVICDDISGTNGSFDRLFVSSLEALDISGVAASNWSLYPTLNSSITFQPGFVLSNVGNSLFFSGVELTDISGGGQDWANFPAVSTVQMNNNSLGGLSTLTYQDGGRLYSLTGNNLFYNNQQITSGAGGAASNWAQFPANNNVNMNNSNLSNVSQIFGSNLALSGSNVTNGNTFTNSLGVGGLSLLPIASITSGGDLSCRNIEVGDSTTSLADVNIYGALAAPGDNALFVIGGTTLTGGTTLGVPVHGTEIGATPVAGVDTMRIDVLPVGIGINAATYVQVAAAGAGSFAAGGALSLAGGDYVEINTDDLRVINTTSGNQSTTLTVANIQMPSSVAATVPLQINNTAGGGINLVGTSGVGQIAGFSTIFGDRLISPSMSTLNINVSSINGVPWEDVSGGVATSLKVVPDFPANPTESDLITGSFNPYNANNLVGVFNSATGNLAPLQVGGNLEVQMDGNSSSTALWRTFYGSDNITFQAQGTGTSFPYLEVNKAINGGENFTGIALLNISTINGQPVDLSGGGVATSTFTSLFADSTKSSTLNVSSISQFGGVPLEIIGSLKFANPSAIDYVDVINLNAQFPPQLQINASTIFIGGNNVTMNSVSTNRLQANQFYTSSISSVTSYADSCVVSTLSAVGGLAIKVNNPLEFATLDAITNVDVINLNPLAVPALAIGASTITLDANNVTTNSLSTLRHSTSALQFSTATSVGSNTAFNYPIFLDYDHAGAGTNASGVGIAIAGHNFGTGAVINRIEMGARGNGENYIMSVWPGQNLEDLFIDATDVIFRDGAFSTIINLDPYGLITTGAISAPALLVSSINGAPVGGAVSPNLAVSSLSTVQLALSTIQMYNDAGTTPAGPSSLMNINFGYNGSTGQNGLSLENYVNFVDNLDIYLTGNADGASIKSWTNYRSSPSELFIAGNTVTVSVDDYLIVADNTTNDFSLIGPTLVSTSYLGVSSINGYDANPAYTNNIQTSTMELYANSTTLLYWDSTTVSRSINTSGYDVVVGLNGTFKIGASLQLNNQSGTDEVEFFFLKNNAVISNAGGIVNVLNNDEVLTYCEIIEPLVNGDTIQVGCYTANSNVFLSTINGTILQSPAAILTAYKID